MTASAVPVFSSVRVPTRRRNFLRLLRDRSEFRYIAEILYTTAAGVRPDVWAMHPNRCESVILLWWSCSEGAFKSPHQASHCFAELETSAGVGGLVQPDLLVASSERS